MSSHRAFILPAPWAHFDPDVRDLGIGRKPLSHDQITVVAAGLPLYLAAKSGSKIRLSGFRMGAHPLGGTYRVGEDVFELFLLSVGTRPNENLIEVEIDDEHAGTIEITGYVPRPAHSGAEENDSIPSIIAERVDALLLSIIDLIQMPNDPNYMNEQVMWAGLAVAWEGGIGSTIPPMALIVRHAQKLQRMVQDLSRRPRHILRRTREMTPVDRAQQLDVACVRWLSHQPGRDVYECAGPRQRILAVQRHQSLDTLENRVFRDFSLRSGMAARAYKNRYEKLENTVRFKRVSAYGRRCQRAEFGLRQHDVANASPPVVPNFVLLHDPRYRRLWRAYLEILRQSDEEDECWRWQHRLWLDFIRLLIHLSMRLDDRFSCVAENPLRIADEQFRGIWTDAGEQSGTWLVDVPEVGDCVISFIWSPTVSHPKVEPWIMALGCGALIHVQTLADQRECYIPIWGVHSFSPDAPDVARLSASATRALSLLRSNLLLTDGRRLALAGIVLMSDVNQASRNQPLFRAHFDDVHGYQFGANYRDRTSMLRIIPGMLLALIKVTLGDGSAKQ